MLVAPILKLLGSGKHYDTSTTTPDYATAIVAATAAAPTTTAATTAAAVEWWDGSKQWEWPSECSTIPTTE